MINAADLAPVTPVGPELAPFSARDVFGFTLDRPTLTFPPANEAAASLLQEDIRASKFALEAAVKSERAARARGDERARRAAHARRLEHERWLVQAHVELLALADPYPYPHGLYWDDLHP